MAPKLILFDVDGTLVDMSGVGRRAMERAFAEVFGVHGVDRLTGVAFAGRTDPVILDAVAGALGLEPARLDSERERLIESFLDGLHAELRRPDPRRQLLPGVRPLLDQLDALDDVHLGLVTGNLEAGARAKLEPFDLNRFFPAGGFASDDPDRRRIARIGWRKLCELTGIDFPPGDVTIVGDTEHDVDCARANGFRAVAVDSGWVRRSNLEEARPDVLLDDLGDLRQTLEALGVKEVVS